MPQGNIMQYVQSELEYNIPNSALLQAYPLI